MSESSASCGPRLRGRRAGEGTDDTHVLVTPPSWRPDLVDAPDYAEEVARIDGYKNIPSISADPERRPRPDPRAEGAAGSSPTRWPARGFTEVLSYPFVAEELADQLDAARPTTTVVMRSGWPTRCPRRGRCCAPRSSRASSTRCAATSRAAQGRRDVRARSRLPSGRRRSARRRSRASASVPTPRPSSSCMPPCPHQPRRAGILATGQAEQAGWWGPGRAADWSDMVAAVQTVAAALAVPVVVAQRPRPRPVAPGPVRADHARRRHRSSGTPGSCTPRSSRARPAGAHRGGEFDVDVLVAASADRSRPARSRRSRRR